MTKHKKNLFLKNLIKTDIFLFFLKLFVYYFLFFITIIVIYNIKPQWIGAILFYFL